MCFETIYKLAQSQYWTDFYEQGANTISANENENILIFERFIFKVPTVFHVHYGIKACHTMVSGDLFTVQGLLMMHDGALLLLKSNILGSQKY